MSYPLQLSPFLRAFNPRQKEILEFWFGKTAEEQSTARNELWFTDSKKYDGEIKERFGRDVEEALKGGYKGWEGQAEGTLSLLLLLDQFTRQIYRGTPQAFSGDPQALRLCLQGLDASQDAALPFLQRVFFYMPLMHSEDPLVQERSVQAFTALKDQALAQDHPLLPTLQYNVKFAHDHKNIVDRFGRFPHRNQILGRESTEEEKEFLTLPGSSF